MFQFHSHLQFVHTHITLSRMKTTTLLIFTLVLFIPNCLLEQGNVGTTIYHTPGSSVVRYTHGAQRDLGLPICKKIYSVCGIVHNRFWFLPLIVRLCQCEHNKECKSQYTSDLDDRTMAMNSRAQMKFCNDVTALPLCTSKTQTALWWEEQRHETNKQAIVNVSLTAECYCPKYRYYKNVETNTTPYPNNTRTTKEKYACKPLRKCKSGDFCGHITDDMYETYFICACPYKHKCVFRGRDTKKVKELMYNDRAYEGICTHYEDW